MLPPPSGYEMEAEVPPNRWYVSTILHDVKSEKSAMLMFHVRLCFYFFFWLYGPSGLALASLRITVHSFLS
jgi:hypothetical protein